MRLSHRFYSFPLDLSRDQLIKLPRTGVYSHDSFIQYAECLLQLQLLKPTNRRPAHTTIFHSSESRATASMNKGKRFWLKSDFDTRSHPIPLIIRGSPSLSLFKEILALDRRPWEGRLSWGCGWLPLKEKFHSLRNKGSKDRSGFNLSCLRNGIDWFHERKALLS